MNRPITEGNTLEEVLREIQSRERLLVTSHARPDGDAIGSVLGCTLVLRAMGKKADAVLHDGVPRIYRSLPHTNEVLRCSSINGDYDAAIILECDSTSRTRLEGLEKLFLISIDHHASARDFANVNWIESHAAATAEMVFRLAKGAGVKITPEMATCLYTALLTDTGSFCYKGTDVTTFALAQELVGLGADPVKIAQAVYFANPTSKMRLLGAALSNLQRKGNLTWMWVTREDMFRTEAREEDCEGLVNYALGIEGVEVAVFLREIAEGRFRVSLRSKGALNVAAVAETFGGGGHECASGFSIEGPLATATATILGCLHKHGYGK